MGDSCDGEMSWPDAHKAEAKCMSQDHFNDYMKNSIFHKIEDPKLILSHKYEDKSPLRDQYE